MRHYIQEGSNMKAALYARVSKKDGKQDTENQLRQLRQFCQHPRVDDHG